MHNFEFSDDIGWDARRLASMIRRGEADPEKARSELVIFETFATEPKHMRSIELLRREIESQSRLGSVLAQLGHSSSAHFRLKDGTSVMFHPAVQSYAPPGSTQITQFHSDGEPWGHRYGQGESLASVVRDEWIERGGLGELIEHRNPPRDEMVRHLERIFAESGTLGDWERLAREQRRAGMENITMPPMPPWAPRIMSRLEVRVVLDRARASGSRVEATYAPGHGDMVGLLKEFPGGSNRGPVGNVYARAGIPTWLTTRFYVSGSAAQRYGAHVLAEPTLLKLYNRRSQYGDPIYPGEFVYARELGEDRRGRWHNPLAAHHGSSRDPAQVLGPTWPGTLNYWDVRFEDEGFEGTVGAFDLYTPAGARWQEPRKHSGGWRALNPPRQNRDELLRGLERRSLSGDPEAWRRFLVELRRGGLVAFERTLRGIGEEGFRPARIAWLRERLSSRYDLVGMLSPEDLRVALLWWLENYDDLYAVQDQPVWDGGWGDLSHGVAIGTREELVSTGHGSVMDLDEIRASGSLPRLFLFNNVGLSQALRAGSWGNEQQRGDLHRRLVGVLHKFAWRHVWLSPHYMGLYYMGDDWYQGDLFAGAGGIEEGPQLRHPRGLPPTHQLRHDIEDIY